MQEIKETYTNGNDNLYIVKNTNKYNGKVVYMVCTLIPANTFQSDGITYNVFEEYISTGYDFATMTEAKKHVQSFGFKKAA